MKQPSYKNLKLDSSTIINLEKGKLPPQAIDLEEVAYWWCSQRQVKNF